MNRKKIIWIIAGGFSFLLVGFWIGRAGAGAEKSETEGAVVESEADAETLWTCSMHPQVKQSEPGSCPICGMDLIPLEEDSLDSEDAGDLPRLTLSKRSAALIDVQTSPVERREVERAVRLSGTIDFDERKLGVISARTSGRIEALFVSFTGEKVEKGEPMVEFYSPALVSAQEEFLQALKSAGNVSENRLAEAARQRLFLLGLSDKQISEIEESGLVLDRLRIESPMTGTVIERQAKAGKYVEAGDPLFSIADLSGLWVNLEAHASDLPALAPGESVVFSSPAVPGKEFEGEIEFIEPVFNEAARTVRVRSSVLNEDQLLKPGMFVRAEVFAKSEGRPLVIPKTAPLLTGKRSIVYVKIPNSENPTFEAREVILGPKAGDYYRVEDGLEEGEIVVSRGSFKIDSELQIRGRPSMMSPADPDSDSHSEHEFEKEVLEEIDPEFSKNAIELIESYLTAVEGLAEDDSGKTKVAFVELRERLRAIDENLLSEESKKIWLEIRKNLLSVLGRIGSNGSLERARDYLQELTIGIERLHLNFAGDFELHQAYCPMANDDAGATWLQVQKEINNPYFGASMLRCGEIVGQETDHHDH